MPAQQPHEIIADLAAKYDALSDAGILSALVALPDLPDESDTVWDDDAFWLSTAYPYIALGDVAAARRLTQAIPILLAKACFGDPGEIMRGLRHKLEAIVAPNWDVLIDACIQAAASTRLGTKLWALDQLAVLEDERACSTFQEALRHDDSSIREASALGLQRLVDKGRN